MDMLDHMTIRVRDAARTRDFLRVALAPLGYELVKEMNIPGIGLICGFSKPGKPDLWITNEAEGHIIAKGGHVALRARRRRGVDAFHAAALAAGARDDGAPGPRPEYHPGYYGAFVIEENGVHLEACCHTGEWLLGGSLGPRLSNEILTRCQQW